MFLDTYILGKDVDIVKRLRKKLNINFGLNINAISLSLAFFNKRLRK